MRYVIGLAFLLASCSQDATSPTADGNTPSAQATPTGVAPAEMARARAAAETEMRRLLGSGTATITEVAEYKTQPRTGLAVLCGSYDLDGTSYRFVFLEEALMILESQGGALASNMDEAFAGYCR